MISNINELVRITGKWAEQTPLLGTETLITTPGCSQSEINDLRKRVPGIPESFLSVIEKICIFKISMGFFKLWCGFGKESYVEGLVRINTGLDSPYKAYNDKYRIYEVASLEADPIAVARRDSPLGDGVVVMFLHDNLKVPPRRLAKNFETFLLLAGNLIVLCELANRNYESAIKEFQRVIERFTVREDEAKEWHDIAKWTLEPLD